MRAQTATLAAAAARLVVEEGLEYGLAKRKAARALRSRAALPSGSARTRLVFPMQSIVPSTQARRTAALVKYPG